MYITPALIATISILIHFTTSNCCFGLKVALFSTAGITRRNIESLSKRRMSTTTISSSTTEKATVSSSVLNEFRSKLSSLGLDAYLIPSDDPHLSEYVASAYGRRAYISGFDGSAGTALVFDNSAYLWTDSRYFNQANQQLGSDWKLMKDRLVETPTIPKFLADKALAKYEKDGIPLKVGIDPFVHSNSFVKELQEGFIVSEEKVVGEVVSLENNLVDEVWNDRPALPSSPFRVHPLKYAGMSVADKISLVQEKLRKEKAVLLVFSALDDIAYLFNVRANDIDCNPVGLSYATVHIEKGATLYCNPDKVTSADVMKHFTDASVQIAPYDQIIEDLKGIPSKEKVWIDCNKTNFAIASLMPKKQLLDKTNPIVYMKACKNEAELEGMRLAHLVDGIAMAKFISWLEEEVQKRPVDEMEIHEKLTAERAKQPGFFEPSFPTIAGVGSNGAIIHYCAKNDSLLKKLDLTQPILIDSGGQFEYGTTDVTRTWFFGSPSDISHEFKDMYTAVLKCNIMLDTSIFPENTAGCAIDAFARRHLWLKQRDYGHGTGHGVGAALNVHEGPMSISPRFKNLEPLKPNHIVSNEPGFYLDGKYGIRIENLCEVVSLDRKEGDDKSFLKFQKITLIPIQKDLILIEEMSQEELDWLDEYHLDVWQKVGPQLEDGSKEKQWLQRMCSKIDRKQ